MMALRVIQNAADAASVWDERYSAQHVASPFCDFEFIASLAELFGWQTSTVIVGDVLAARVIVRSRGHFMLGIMPAGVFVSRPPPERGSIHAAGL